MRRAKTVPLVPVAEGCQRCCRGILTAQAAEMSWWQRITYGTTAWRISTGRRQVVESVNAALKGVFTDLGRGFMAGMFLFFALMGNQIGKVRRNFYIGVKVPWTLASDRVWNDTHRLAAWVMFAAGVVGFILVVSGVWIVIPIVLLVAAGLIPVIYSFVHYKSLERRGAL